MKKSSKKETRRYTEAFKLQVISELEQGGTGVTELQKKYDICGSATIGRWLKRYGKNHLINKKVIIMTPDEQTALVKKEAKIKELEQVIVRLNLEQFKTKMFYEQALRELGEEQTVFEKKSGTKHSPNT
jgi:transposase